MSITRSDKTTSISTQMDSLIPQSKISTLTQGMFVGAVADNFSERIEQKIFHCEIVVDNAKVAKETAAYRPIPVLTDFTNENGEDMMEQEIKANYDRVKTEVRDIVERELQRIADDPELSKLLSSKNHKKWVDLLFD